MSQNTKINDLNISKSSHPITFGNQAAIQFGSTPVKLEIKEENNNCTPTKSCDSDYSNNLLSSFSSLSSNLYQSSITKSGLKRKQGYDDISQNVKRIKVEERPSEIKQLKAAKYSSSFSSLQQTIDKLNIKKEKMYDSSSSETDKDIDFSEQQDNSDYKFLL